MTAFVPGADTQAVVDAIDSAAERVCQTIELFGKRIERQLKHNDENMRALTETVMSEVADTHQVLLNMLREVVDGEEFEHERESAEYDERGH